MMLYLAPLHGVTNRVFREAYARHFGGFDVALAPFILAVPSSRSEAKHFKDVLPRRASGIPLVPQLLGNESVAFVETARLLHDSGYAEINWNLGCPQPMVAGKFRGSGLLPYPERIGALLDAACAIPDLRISVKLRLGRSDPEDIIRLMPLLNEHPLSSVIIHPRLGTQMYRGRVDLDGFERAAALCRHPLVYNGDIDSRAAFEALSSRFPAIDAWMIGRGAIANPFLPEEIKTGAVRGDRIARLRAWHDDLYRSYREILCGPAHPLDKMKEVWSYLGSSFPGKPRQLERIALAKSPEAYEAAASELFGRR